MPDADEAEIDDSDIDTLIERIRVAHGIDLGLYRRRYLKRRISARMRMVGINVCSLYGDMIETTPHEYAQFMNTLTINVTEFFRDQPVWDLMRQEFIPELIERKSVSRSHTIRAWSAGCATGEEPYSLAMQLLDMVDSSPAEIDVSIMATDIDSRALGVAKDAIFHNAKASNLPQRYRVRFTEESGPTQFRIAQEVRDVVRFRKLSLFVDTPVRVIDLLLCRNVLIYVDRPQQERILDNFVKALSPGGYLVLGRSEKLSAAASEALETVNGRERIYRKQERKRYW